MSSAHVKFRPDNHIIGKVYDLTQENFNAVIRAWEDAVARAEAAEFDAAELRKGWAAQSQHETQTVAPQGAQVEGHGPVAGDESAAIPSGRSEAATHADELTCVHGTYHRSPCAECEALLQARNEVKAGRRLPCERHDFVIHPDTVSVSKHELCQECLHWIDKVTQDDNNKGEKNGRD